MHCCLCIFNSNSCLLTGLYSQIAGLTNVNIVDIDVGYNHAMAVSSSGDVYVWGAWLVLCQLLVPYRVYSHAVH